MADCLLTGIWQTASDSRYVWYGADWPSFTAKAKTLADSGYSLTSLDVTDNGGSPLWAGNWTVEVRSQKVAGAMLWSEFQDYNTQAAVRGFQLFRLRTCADTSGRTWAGVWQLDPVASVLIGPMPWNEFWTTWLAQHAAGHRLVDFDTYSTDGSRFWIGLWRPGIGDQYIWVDSDWLSLTEKSSELRSKGYQLNTVRSYAEGPKRNWAALWRETRGDFALVSDLTEDQFWAEWNRQAANGMLLSYLHIWRGGTYAPAPTARARVRVHLKILSEPTVAVHTMIDRMREVYEPAGFLVDVGSVEKLNRSDLIDLDAGSCSQSTTTAAQQRLFAARDNMGTLDVAAYFVRTTLPPYNGCAAYPPGRPGVVISSYATEWTLAHEIGHVLGLYHVIDNTRLMTGLGTANIIPPPGFTLGEMTTMLASPYAISV